MYDFFVNRVVVTFKLRNEDPIDPTKGQFDLTLSKKNNYEQVCIFETLMAFLIMSQLAQRVGTQLDWDPAKLRFTAASTNGQPKTAPLRRSAPATVAEMVQPSYTATPMPVLYYEKLEIPLSELESKRTLRITWMGTQNKEESQHNFLMNKACSFHEVTDTLLKNVKLGSNGYGSGKVRIFNIENGRKLRIFSHGETIREADVNDLYAEVRLKAILSERAYPTP